MKKNNLRKFLGDYELVTKKCVSDLLKQYVSRISSGDFRRQATFVYYFNFDNQKLQSVEQCSSILACLGYKIE